MQTENSELKERLSNLQLNFEKLSDEHKILQATLILERVKINDKCKNCQKTTGNRTDMKKHKNPSELFNIVFKCDKCDKEFNEQWMILMMAHAKTHKK